MRVFSVFIIFFGLITKAQAEPALEAETTIGFHFKLSNPDISIETSLDPIRLVDRKTDIELSAQKVKLFRMAPNLIEVHLQDPIEFRVYEKSKSSLLVTLDKFLLKGEDFKLDKMMKFSDGVMISDEVYQAGKVKSFIETMKTDGFNINMLNYIKDGLPIGLYEVIRADITLPLEPLIRGEATEAINDWYTTRVASSKLVYGSNILTMQRRLLEWVDVIDIKDPLMNQYTEAIADLRYRVSTLKARGWWDHLASGDFFKAKYQTNPVDPSLYNNVEWLHPACRQIFQ